MQMSAPPTSQNSRRTELGEGLDADVPHLVFARFGDRYDSPDCGRSDDSGGHGGPEHGPEKGESVLLLSVEAVVPPERSSRWIP